MANKGMLLSRIIKNIVLAVSIIAVPTIILLGIIAGKFVAVQDGAVIVDVSLGVLLGFTSLAAVTAPFIYGPVSVLAATSLARSWISASSQSSANASIVLPSTPQYLLAVGNLGVPSFGSFGKSVQYISNRRSDLSPVLTQSTITLGSLLFMAMMVTIGDIWVHLSSTAVLDSGVLGTRDLHDYSRAFAPPENSSDAPWRLQQGVRTFLGVNSDQVVEVGDTMVLVPSDIPSNQAVEATTIGMDLNCQLVNSDCIFSSESTPTTFDCSQSVAGATGTFGNTVNVTLYPSRNSSNIQLLAAMDLPTLFNASAIILPTQVFQCSGTLLNVTFTGFNGDFGVIGSSALPLTPITELWNLDEFPGKSSLIETLLGHIGTSTIIVQGTNTTTVPSVFAQGLSRLFVSLLSGQTIPSPSLKESPSSNSVLSRIPLAPIIFLCVVVTITIIAISVVGFRALLAVIHPPRLRGNPISVDNLHRQLTSPIAVLKNTIGETPLAMKIVFDGQSHHSVEFDVQTPPSTRNGAKSESPGFIQNAAGSVNRRAGEMSEEEQRVVFEMQERRRENGREVETRREEDEMDLVQSPHPTEFEEISPVTNSLRYSWSQHSFLPAAESHPQIYRL